MPFLPTARLGPSDLVVSRICFGGNVFGWTADRDMSYSLLDNFFAAGGNFVDTADAYSAWVPGHSGGESERILGSWMADRRNRDRMVVATKVGKKPGLENLRPETIRTACEESLDRLQTDYIDLYYCHADDRDTPLGATLGALAELVREGKVRYIAASNYEADRLAEALRISDELGAPRFVALQPHFNLVHRQEYEGPLMRLCEREDISCLPYFALAAGFLTGKYRSAEIGDVARAPRVSGYASDHGWRVLAAVDEVAAAHGVSNAEVAIAWLMRQPTVAAPIASATSLPQLEDVLGAAALHLTDADFELLTAASQPD